MNLTEIISQHCVPARNCMLTVFSYNNETGFMYFENGELIESNTGPLWGNDAVQEIAQWSIQNFQMGELPLGIKRSIWISVQDIATAGVAASVEEMPVDAEIQADDDDVWTKIRNLPGCLCVYLKDKQELSIVIPQIEGNSLSLDDLALIEGQIAQFGKSLGAGNPREWSFDTDLFKVFSYELELRKFLVLVLDTSVDIDDTRLQLRAILEGEA